MKESQKVQTINASDKTIGEIVADDYRTARVFERYGIDFCCGGKVALAAACTAKNVDPAAILNELDAAKRETAGQTQNYASWELPFLADYIVNVHHAYIKENAEQTAAYARKIAAVHGAHHPELIEIAAIFDKVAVDMAAHLREEEEVFFPAVRRAYAETKAGSAADAKDIGTIRELLVKLLHEHEEVGNAIHAIRHLAKDYAIPDDVCNTFVVAYRKLKEFEDDLHTHVHLENNILFPKAEQLHAQGGLAAGIKKCDSRKVVIVGAGDVGASFAYALLQSGTAESIVLVDARHEQAKGQALDLAHGLPFVPAAVVRAGSPDDYADAAVIVITAGAKQKPGESRLDLLRKNAGILKQIVDEIAARESQAVIVVASNPVDLLTYFALKQTGWTRNRIIGSGTVLDSARFRHLLSMHCGVDVKNVHAYILGEHGDSEVPAWSMTHLAGMSMEDYCPACRKCSDWMRERDMIVAEVRDSAYNIIEAKGSTCYAIGLALVRIVGAILRNEHSVLTVSTLLDGEYGLNDVCLSVPCIVSQSGVERIIEGKLANEEMLALRASAFVIKERLSELTRSDDGRQINS
ncbi:MAG: L-lactate dehydrogenase [Victivallaceae bacterium]|jgi:L-lactate dehydrogenase